jgi:DNA-binding response OmpR family regulator
MTDAQFRILFVEDDAEYREALCHILNLEGFSADGVGTIAAFLAWRATHAYDLLIVDRQLPDGDGLDALRVHRRSAESPAIVLTARGKVADRVAGLEADADYYLVKPVAMDELLALLRRLQRRFHSRAAGHWTVDPATWRLRAPDGIEIALTRRELALLLLFPGRQGQPVPRQEIAAGLGEDPAVYDPRRLEILVRRLRHKVEEAAARELPLATVYGIGYAFNLPLVRE